MLLILLVTALQPANVLPTPVRGADATFARCYAKIFRSYLTTSMANASGLAREKLRVGTFVHSHSGMEYKISVSDDRASMFAELTMCENC